MIHVICMMYVLFYQNFEFLMDYNVVDKKIELLGFEPRAFCV